MYSRQSIVYSNPFRTYTHSTPHFEFHLAYDNSSILSLKVIGQLELALRQVSNPADVDSTCGLPTAGDPQNLPVNLRSHQLVAAGHPFT